jgi:hypothetical protein
MRGQWAITVALSMAAIVCGATYLAVAADSARTGFKITTKRATDRVDVIGEADRAVFSIHSPFGISQAVIARADGTWPREVVVRLHLEGLSHLRVTNGQVVLEAAMASDDDTQRVRLWKDGKEDLPLNSRSDLWMEIRVMGQDGKPARHIPLRGGYFEMELPRALFADGPKSITIQWIDFYRG